MPRKLPTSYIRSLEWDAEMVEVSPHCFVNRAIESKKRVAAKLPSSPALDWPCKGIAWDCPGHSPITKSDRLDARFVNTLGKPPRKGKQIVGPAPDIERSNLEPGESVFDRRKLPFDRGRFKTGQRLDYVDLRADLLRNEDGSSLTKGLRPCDTGAGAAVPAVWEREKKGRGRASVGGDVSAEGNTPSYEYLIGRARRPLNLVNLGRPLAALMKSRRYRPKKIKSADGIVKIEHVVLARHNRRLLPHTGFRGWFGQKYPHRWDQPASCYVDFRIDGKATNSFDLTWSQAATGIADEASDNLSTRQYRTEGCPLIFYEKPVLGFALLWVMAGLNFRLNVGARPTGRRTVAGLRVSYLLQWMLCAEGEEGTPWRYVSSNIYWRRSRWAAARVGKIVSLDELLSIKSPRLDRYYRECFRPLAARCGRPSRVLTRSVAPTERDKVIADHWPLVVSKCREKVPQAERADAIQACMERLVKVYDDDWRPAHGTFGTFAAQAIDWAIQDFMRDLRRQVPVQRSINLNDPAPTDDDDDNTQTPEQPDMTNNFSSLEKQAAIAKRRLVAEQLDRLNLRERRVIEGRLALNGHKDPVRRRVLAADLGISETMVKEIESQAVRKLRLAIFPKETTVCHCGNAAPVRIY